MTAVCHACLSGVDEDQLTQCEGLGGDRCEDCQRAHIADDGCSVCAFNRAEALGAFER